MTDKQLAVLLRAYADRLTTIRFGLENHFIPVIGKSFVGCETRHFEETEDLNDFIDDITDQCEMLTGSTIVKLAH
jgi:hypothetical protein